MKAEETSMSYRAPIADILFAMTHEAGMDLGLKDGIYADLGDGLAEATLREAGKFAENVLAPLNRIGDKEGAKFEGIRARGVESARGALFEGCSLRGGAIGGGLRVNVMRAK